MVQERLSCTCMKGVKSLRLGKKGGEAAGPWLRCRRIAIIEVLKLSGGAKCLEGRRFGLVSFNNTLANF